MSSKSNTNSVKPKRPLTPYNLFYRYKRVKIIDATKGNSNIDKEDVHKLIESTPGLENYPSAMRNTIPPDQLDGIRRTIIRLALDQHLLSKDTRKRRHRKSGNGFKLSFLEMNRIMVATWKEMDDFTKAIFKELAEEAKEEHHRQLAEYNYEAHVSALPVFPFPSQTVSAEVTPTPMKPSVFLPSQEVQCISSSSNNLLVSPETSRPVFPPPLVAQMDTASGFPAGSFTLPTLDVGALTPLPAIPQQFCQPLLGNVRQVTVTSEDTSIPANKSPSYPVVHLPFPVETNNANTMYLPFELEPEDFPIQPKKEASDAGPSANHKRNVSVDDFMQLINALKDD